MNGYTIYYVQPSVAIMYDSGTLLLILVHMLNNLKLNRGRSHLVKCRQMTDLIEDQNREYSNFPFSKNSRRFFPHLKFLPHRGSCLNSIHFNSLFHFIQGTTNFTVFQVIYIINKLYIQSVINSIHDIVYYIISVLWKQGRNQLSATLHPNEVLMFSALQHYYLYIVMSFSITHQKHYFLPVASSILI